MNTPQYYKVGHHVHKDGGKDMMEQLQPMTHEQACNFKSNMMDPTNHFLYEVDVQEGEEVL